MSSVPVHGWRNWWDRIYWESTAKAQYRHYSWRQFEKDCLRMARVLDFGRKTYGKSTFTSIFGIPRGGMMVATRLSYMLNLPIVDRSQISSTTLIVDDIIGSGKTMADFMRSVPTKSFAALVVTVDASQNSKLSILPRKEGAEICRSTREQHLYALAMELFFVYGRIVPVRKNQFVVFPWAREDKLH